MDENTEPWDKNVPADLIPAIKHLRKSFDEVHWGCGHTTGTFCYSLLRNEALDDPAKEYSNYLMHIKARVGPAATQRFHHLIKAGTPSAIFKGFYDLYLAGTSIQALIIFKELAEIGRANEKRLGVPHLEWAEAQTKHLIRSHTHNISIWVRDVCDKQAYDPKEDPEEWIFWRKWQAPKFLVMKPAGGRPYDAATAWERNDAALSSQWLKSFTEHYVLHLEMNLERASGEAGLELAKQSKPIVTSSADKHVAAERHNRYTPTTARREARKLDTQDIYRNWQKEYQALKKRRPDMSDVWYSQQIARMPIARSSSAETIRKHMKK